MLEIVCDSFIDTLKTFPFLFGAYLLIEWIAHRAGDAFKDGLRKFGMFGSVGGAILGLVPQCGFSVVAANFYADRIITPGTLVAVFISTSDEALPILLSNPENCKHILPLLGVKLLFAVIVGLTVDLGFKRFWKPFWDRHTELNHHHDGHRHEHSADSAHDSSDFDSEEECHHEQCHGSVWGVALKHSLLISLLIFVISALLNIGLDALGDERTKAFLMSGNMFQPVAAALFGLIPSCAASVFLTQMYVEGSLSFGSVVAGLSTGAGTGILILCQATHRKREAFLVLAFIFVVASIVGMLL